MLFLTAYQWAAQRETGSPYSPGNCTAFMVQPPAMAFMLEEKILRTNTILYCRHWQPTVVFYRDVLKLTVNHETDWMVEFRLSDNSYLSIADTERATVGHAKGQGITLSFQIHDVNRIKSQLKRLGIETSDTRLVWGRQAFYINDPDGHRIELWA